MFLFIFYYSKQLGYSVSCGVRQTHGTLGFCFQVMSCKYSVAEVVAAILQFVASIPDEIITASSVEHFKDNVDALRGNKLSPDQSLSDAARVHWAEIEEGAVCFDVDIAQGALLCDSVHFGQHSMSNFSRELLLTAPKLLIVQATRGEATHFAALPEPAFSGCRIACQTNEVRVVHSLLL